MIKRNFHTDKSNKKWLTDITEFAILVGKVYLSLILDYFNGMISCWTIGINPNASLVNNMLDQAISILREDEHPIIHSDRGVHYRRQGWIERIKQAGLNIQCQKRMLS